MYCLAFIGICNYHSKINLVAQFIIVICLKLPGFKYLNIPKYGTLLLQYDDIFICNGTKDKVSRVSMSQVLKPSFILSHLLSSIPIKYLWQYRDIALFTIPNLVNYILFRHRDNIVSPNRFIIHILKGNSCIRLSSTVLVHNRSIDSTLEFTLKSIV